jgi:hypothetical protein
MVKIVVVKTVKPARVVMTVETVMRVTMTEGVYRVSPEKMMLIQGKPREVVSTKVVRIAAAKKAKMSADLVPQLKAASQVPQ